MQIRFKACLLSQIRYNRDTMNCELVQALHMFWQTSQSGEDGLSMEVDTVLCITVLHALRGAGGDCGRGGDYAISCDRFVFQAGIFFSWHRRHI